MSTAITISDDQRKNLFKPTPAEYIKTKPGRGGTSLAYVETGYVVRELNNTFNHLWDFDVLDQQVGKDHIWVKGKLTVKITPELSISKTQFGGAEVKRFAPNHPKAGEVVDVADDMKAAASDALKKCASMLGVAADVYFPHIDQSEDTLNGDAEAVFNDVEKSTPKAIKNPPKAQVKGGEASVACTDCGESSASKMSEKVIAFSSDRYGRPLCYDCQQKL